MPTDAHGYVLGESTPVSAENRQADGNLPSRWMLEHPFGTHAVKAITYSVLWKQNSKINYDRSEHCLEEGSGIRPGFLGESASSSTCQGECVLGSSIT